MFGIPGSSRIYLSIIFFTNTLLIVSYSGFNTTQIFNSVYVFNIVQLVESEFKKCELLYAVLIDRGVVTSIPLLP